MHYINLECCIAESFVISSNYHFQKLDALEAYFQKQVLFNINELITQKLLPMHSTFKFKFTKMS